MSPLWLDPSTLLAEGIMIMIYNLVEQIRRKDGILKRPIMQGCLEIHIYIKETRYGVFFITTFIPKTKKITWAIYEHTQQLGDDLCCCNAAYVFHCEPPKRPCFSIPLKYLVFAFPYQNTNVCEYNFMGITRKWQEEKMRRFWKSLVVYE